MRQFFVITALWLSMIPTAHADDELDALLSEEVITTASRSEESSRTAPGISTSITADQLRTYGLRTIAEAIDFIALGVSTSGRNQHGAAVELGSRGVLLTGDTGNHFLLMVDGHAVNEISFGTARFDRGAGIPMEAVDHIEVTVGPGAVLYGNNAMLGVINVILKPGSNLDGGYVVGTVSSAGSGRVGAAVGQAFEWRGEPGEILLAAEYFERQGPNFTVGPQALPPQLGGAIQRTSRDNSTPGIWGGTLSEGNFARVPSMIMTVDYSDWQVIAHIKEATFGDPFGPEFFDESKTSTEDRSLWLEISHNWVLPMGVDLMTRVYADGYSRFSVLHRGASQCGPDIGAVCRAETTRISRWAGLELRTNIDWFQDQKLQTSFGVDERVRYSGAKTDRINDATGAPFTSSIATYENTDIAFGAFAQQVWNISRTVGINVGARVDEDQRYEPVLSPRAAVSVAAWEGGVAKAMYSKAFRAPGRLATDAEIQFHVTPDELRPEIVHSGELVIEQTLGYHRAIVGVFRSLWLDMTEIHVLTPQERTDRFGAALDQYVVNEISQLRNVSEIDSYGVNAGYKLSSPDQRLTAGGNVTYAISRESRPDGSDREMTVAPQLSANARTAYSFGESLPRLGIAASYLGKRLANRAHNNGFNPIPEADAQLNVRATVSGLVWGAGYRVSADYAITDHGPYTIGAVEQGSIASPSAELNPVQPFTAYAELSYDF